MKKEKRTNWIIRNTELLLKCMDGSILYPTAGDIFSSEFHHLSRIQGQQVVQVPSQAIEGLVISRFPLDLSIQIETGVHLQAEGLICRVIGRQAEKEVNIPDTFSRKTDHIIEENLWFPFTKGSLDEIRIILDSCNVSKPGPISLKQYLSLILHEGHLVRIDDMTKKAAGADRIKKSLPSGQIPGFTGTLYPYQMEGYNWLTIIAREDLGCILADEMGLGKTIQIIGLLSSEIASGRIPSLVICPATLLENWRREIFRFAPAVKTLIHRGTDRTAFISDFECIDIIITSYDTVIRDMLLLENIPWNIVVIDEAQSIKNPDAKRTKCVKEIPRRVSIAVTGTPVENRLVDLWSIMDFILPKFLGTREEFERKIANNIEGASLIEPLVTPVMLRRKVIEVAGDLPDRIDIPQVISMDTESTEKYENIRNTTIQQYGSVGNLVALINLRMFCTHPFLLEEGDRNPEKYSSKYRRLLELLEEVFDNSEKALVFTSFSRMVDIISDDLPQHFGSIFVDYIDGRVPIPDRQPKIDIFSAHLGPAVLVLNPKAAGTGLNITAANHVIHYNPEWNPAVEDQASARAHRRGQERPVTIHKLFFADTVEEIMMARLQRKRDLANTAVVGTTGTEDDLEDIMRALRATPSHRE